MNRQIPGIEAANNARIPHRPPSHIHRMYSNFLSFARELKSDHLVGSEAWAARLVHCALANQLVIATESNSSLGRLLPSEPRTAPVIIGNRATAESSSRVVGIQGERLQRPVYDCETGGLNLIRPTSYSPPAECCSINDDSLLALR